MDPSQNASYQCREGLRLLQSWSVFGVATRMVEKCVMGQQLQYTTCCRRWVGTGKLPRFSRERGRPHLRLLDGPRKLVAPRDQARTEACPMEKAGNRRNDMRGIESTVGIDKLATTKVINSTKISSRPRKRSSCASLWMCLDTKEAV